MMKTEIQEEIWDEKEQKWVKVEEEKYRLVIKTKAGIKEVAPFTIKEVVRFHKRIAKAKGAIASTKIRSLI